MSESRARWNNECLWHSCAQRVEQCSVVTDPISYLRLWLISRSVSKYNDCSKRWPLLWSPECTFECLTAKTRSGVRSLHFYCKSRLPSGGGRPLWWKIRPNECFEDSRLYHPVVSRRREVYISELIWGDLRAISAGRPPNLLGDHALLFEAATSTMRRSWGTYSPARERISEFTGKRTLSTR